MTERMSSPWFGLASREDLLEAKRSRRQAERKWRNTNLTVFKEEEEEEHEFIRLHI